MQSGKRRISAKTGISAQIIEEVYSHVKEGQNISTLALRAVRGDGKGTQCPGIWATLFLGDINTGTWPCRLGESQELEQ
jgi:hypothetical protein